MAYTNWWCKQWVSLCWLTKIHNCQIMWWKSYIRWDIEIFVDDALSLYGWKRLEYACLQTLGDWCTQSNDWFIYSERSALFGTYNILFHIYLSFCQHNILLEKYKYTQTLSISCIRYIYWFSWFSTSNDY